MRTLKASLLYFVAVFGAGFVLGPIRIVYVVPRLGTRTAELLETPVMLMITVFAARWIVGRLHVSRAPSSRLAMGLIGLGLMLIAEFGLVLWLRHISLHEYFASRDPVSGIVYYLSLALFALMPLILARW